MFADRIEGKWIDMFSSVFELCKLEPGDTAVIVSETQSRELNVHLAELGLQRLGIKAFHVKLVTPRQESPVPVRSTGASNSVQGVEPVVAALAIPCKMQMGHLFPVTATGARMERHTWKRFAGNCQP